MVHGTSGYFVERARFERRLSLVTLIVAIAFLGVQAILIPPRVRGTISRNFIPLDPKRWGFEGQEQLVRRIVLESNGPLGGTREAGATFVPRVSLHGGTARHHAPSDLAVPDPRRIGIGPGESPEDLLSRARARYHEAPVVQSEDLIIEHLVRPVYPEEARDHDIEGHVALVALIDTTGRVVQVDLMSSSGADLLDHAASDAVWNCRFKPYQREGRVQEVYAMFRFNFRIY